ncbi:DUF1289 domain-containing protein [Oceanimonas marisflavi]|uniref:DUF1289 domain-containing protein n=1 Tax=Oceanimonas marisflavi TaxID=2059724 RepID=UPI000D2F8067|nr:DUF1289 domain-containing protein [Oceanimonas marisflavi]
MNEPVVSPCIGLCRLNEQRLCMGCYRTIDEITGWRERSEQDKAVIVRRAKERQQQGKS